MADIINDEGIEQLKQYLTKKFQAKDLGHLRYFLGIIEVAQCKDCFAISQRKCAFNIVEETEMINANPIDTPMDLSVKLVPNQGEPYFDHERYKLVGKLNYLTVLVLTLSFRVGIISQFLKPWGCSYTNHKVY